MNRTILKRVKVRSYERGLYFRDGEFRGLLGAGAHWFVDPLGKVRVDIVSLREPWLVHDKLDVIVRSGALQDAAIVLDLKDHERALVWIEGRFSHILPPGPHQHEPRAQAELKTAAGWPEAPASHSRPGA